MEFLGRDFGEKIELVEVSLEGVYGVVKNVSREVMSRARFLQADVVMGIKSSPASMSAVPKAELAIWIPIPMANPFSHIVIQPIEGEACGEVFFLKGQDCRDGFFV